MHRYPWFLLFFLLLSYPAFARERVLTLKDAVELSMTGNPELRAMNNSVAAGGEEIGVARSRLLPRLSFEERFMRTTNPTFAFSSKLNQERFGQSDFAIDSLNNPSAINDFQTSLSFEQLLYAPKASAALTLAKKEYSAGLEDLKRKREETAFEVIRTYLMIESASGFMTAAEKSIEDAKEHLRLAESRYDAKLGLYSDVLRARTSLAEAEQRLVSARKNLNTAKRALGVLLGLDEPVMAAGEVPEPPLRELDFYTNASLSRKDVKSLELRHENARKGIDLAWSDYYPVAGLGGSYQFNDHSAPFGGEGESWQVSAFLRWNVFDGGLRRHEASKARFREAEAFERLNGFRRSVSFRVYEAYLAVEEARMNSELSRAAVETAEEGERLVRTRYANSLSPIVDLLDAELSLGNARANYVLRKNEYRTALARLSYESGTLLKDMGLE